MGVALISLAGLGSASRGRVQHASENTRPRTAAGAISGCYQLAFGTWADTEGRKSLPTGLLPPARLELDSIPNADVLVKYGRALYRVRSAMHNTASIRSRTSHWWFLGWDSIAVSWSDGFTGTGMHFRVAGDTLIGGFNTFVDVIDIKMPRGKAAGIRVACGETLDSTKARQRARRAVLHKFVASPAAAESLRVETQAVAAERRKLYSHGPLNFDSLVLSRLHGIIARYRQANGRLPDRLEALGPMPPSRLRIRPGCVLRGGVQSYTSCVVTHTNCEYATSVRFLTILAKLYPPSRSQLVPTHSDRTAFAKCCDGESTFEPRIRARASKPRMASRGSRSPERQRKSHTDGIESVTYWLAHTTGAKCRGK